MKLATLKDSTRDGKLVVVSKDLTRCSEVGHIARTLQAALDDWAHAGPRLARVAQGLEAGAQPMQRFHEHDAAAPLPRAFAYTGGAGRFEAPRDAVDLRDMRGEILSQARLAAIVDDLDFGAGSETAQAAVALLVLLHEVTVDGAHVSSTLSPVAVTPDEVGEDWMDVTLSVRLGRNDKILEPQAAALADLTAAVASAAGSAPLGAGGIVTVPDSKTAGQQAEPGDTLRIEVNDRTGHSIFGAIEQVLKPHS